MRNPIPYTLIINMGAYVKNVIDLIVCSPLEEVIKHELGLLLIELSRSQESEQIVVVIH